MDEPAIRVVIEVPQKIPQKKFELIADSVFRLEGKEVSNGTVISLSGIKLKVCHTQPKGTVLITPDTTIEIQRETKGADIILAIDKSYSMTNTDYVPTRFTAGINAIKFFLEKKIDSNDRIGVMTFAFDTNIILPLNYITSENLDVVIKKLSEVKLGGRTSLANAISSSIEMFMENPTIGRAKSIIILTDGVDNIGDDPLQILKNVCDKGITINTVLIGKQQDEAILKKISETTSGGFYFKATEEELNSLYKNLTEQIKTAKIVDEVCEIKELDLTKIKEPKEKEEVKKKQRKKEKKKTGRKLK